MAADTQIALLHLRPTPGDTPKNLILLETLTREALASGAKIVVAPECATTGFCITEEQVLRGGLGLAEPFTELGTLKELAVAHQAYIVLGLAEIGADRRAYNSAIVLLPDGGHRVQRKRGRSGWHDRGNTPFEVIATKYGCKLGVAICSDTYLMDACRILTLKGADTIICPANWWGSHDQVALWASRAHENGVHLVVANRFGIEEDTRQPGSAWTYDMNDAHSVVLSPNGQVQLDYCRSTSTAPSTSVNHEDGVVLLCSLPCTPSTRPWSVQAREVSAFGALRCTSYRPDLANQPASGLPGEGETNVAVLAYSPSQHWSENIQRVADLLATSTAAPAHVIALPLFGVQKTVNSYQKHWKRDEGAWLQFQKLIDQNYIQLAVTGVLDCFDPDLPPRGSLLIARRDKPLQLCPCIHAHPPTGSSVPQAPLFIDIEHARVGLLFNRDSLFPELPMALARLGCDALLITSHIALNELSSEETSVDHWSQENLIDQWRSLANNGLLVAGCDAGSFGVIATSFNFQSTDVAHPLVQTTFDSSTVRTKYLNAYLDDDLEVLAP